MKNKKVALITGSSRGIGLEIGKLLKNEGYVLSVISRKKEDLRFAYEDEDSVLSLECDVSSTRDLRNAVTKTIEKFNRIDVLVNNAGVNVRSDFINTKEEEWEKAINTNVRGAFFLSQSVGKIMLKQKEGQIINISSILGMKADSVSVQYGISKSALITLTKYLAKLFAPYIRVNCIAPGFIDTDWHEEKTKQRINKIIEKIPLKRFGQPKEIAELCYFLITKGHYITGETIVIDGGYIL